MQQNVSQWFNSDTRGKKISFSSQKGRQVKEIVSVLISDCHYPAVISSNETCEHSC